MDGWGEDFLEITRGQIDPEAVVALTRQLIAVPSHTPEGEIGAAVVLERFLQRSGIPTARQEVGDFGVNVIATVSAESDEIGLLFNGHLDVVPPSSAMTHPPFAAIVEEDQLWGRGAVDMKGGLAAMACALTALQNAGVPLKRSVMLSAVASEEQGCRGTAVLVRRGVSARWAVVGEPTSLDLVIAHKGVDRYQVTIEGRSAHESMPEKGINAIIHAAHIIAILNEKLIPEVGQHDHPLLGRATYNIGTIEGGISRNMVPDRCMFRISKRWLPGDSSEAIRDAIEAAIHRADPEVQISVVRERDVEEVPRPPLEISPDHPLTRTMAAAISRVTGRNPAIRGWAAYTDGALLQVAGIPTVVFGPGDLELAHTDDEHILLSDVITAAEVYTTFALMACS
jgi:acetylornithine deacetylase/succinyl-diaminopimelate desuccinylase